MINSYQLAKLSTEIKRIIQKFWADQHPSDMAIGTTLAAISDAAAFIIAVSPEPEKCITIHRDCFADQKFIDEILNMHKHIYAGGSPIL